MQQQWSKIILLIVGVAMLLIPGVRRLIFFRLLQSRFIRNVGLKFAFSFPFVRQKMMTILFPSKPSKSPASYTGHSDKTIM